MRARARRVRSVTIKRDVTDAVLNPFQSLLADSPWWLMAGLLLVLAYLLGGWRPALVTAACEGVILGVGLWTTRWSPWR